MEFGIFQNGYIPGPSAHVSAHEHLMLMREASYPIHADKHNWKFAWFGEHHCLTEYSHLSSPEVMIGWIAAQTDYIHLGTAITSLPTTKEHPVRIAERAAMLDHFCEGRFEFGTGRGAGSHEVAAFNGTVTSETKAMWNEVINEIPRMWAQRDYSYEGEHFRVPPNHNVLPKPYNDTHPPLWVACGNPATFATAGKMGMGAIAFNFDPAPALKGRIDSYKEAIADCEEPHGSYMNDNIMMTNSLICLQDRDRAREIALMHGRGYLYSMVCLYHDTIPKKEGAPTWPRAPAGPARRGDPRLRHRRGLHAVRHARGGVRAAREVLCGGGNRPARVRPPQRGLRIRGDPRDDRDLRRPGDPRVRPRQGALDREVPGQPRAQVPRVERAPARPLNDAAAQRLVAHPLPALRPDGGRCRNPAVRRCGGSALDQREP